MSENTKIEWADNSWSPWRGCTKVSAGCAHCYAETLSKRNPAVLGQWGKGKPRVLAKNWNDPVKWDRQSLKRWDAERGKGLPFSYPPRTKVFPSLCDWLDDEVPIEWLAQFLGLIQATPNLDWLLLTKRPELFRQRMLEAQCRWQDNGATFSAIEAFQWIESWINGNPPPNVWIGTSVEDQANADRRIPALLKIPARLRFLSVEPMLGPVDLKLMRRSFGFPQHITKDGHAVGMPQGIHWVIIGGESGPGARPCNVDWIRSGVQQCAAAGVSCFVKQVGSQAEYGIPTNAMGEELIDVAPSMCLKHPKGGDPDEWPEDIRVRQMPEVKP